MTRYKVGGPARYEHQRRGLNRLIENRGVTALLFDPGLGKTAVVIDYAGLLALKLPMKEARVLVICPLVAVDTWVLQAQIFASPQVHFWAEALGGPLKQRAVSLANRGPYAGEVRSLNHSKSHIVWSSEDIDPADGPDSMTGKPLVVMEVLNIDTFMSRTRIGSRTMADHMLNAVLKFQPDLVVVDESHKIKGAQSNASRLLGRLSRRVPRRVILTGTVMPHSPLDVFGQWRFLQPLAFGEVTASGVRKPASFGRFKDRYAVQGGWMGKEIVRFKNLDEMQKVMAQNSIVARKADALDLPPITEVMVPVELSPAEKRAYKDLKTRLATQLQTGNTATVSNRLVQMMRLRQITSGHLPDDAGNTVRLGDSKVRTIKSIVEDTLAGEKRIVIFALFTHEIDMLSRALAVHGTEVMTITGKTDMKERVHLRERFGSDDPQRIVMVAQIKTMSLAVNELVTANHAIFASLSQQRDDLVQARDRLHRIGQKSNNVTFWYALAPGTVDSVIMRSHQDRTDLENAMLKHIFDSE